MSKEDYKMPMKYNAYLLEKYKLLGVEDYKKSNLGIMFEYGRVSGEMLRSASEYINYLSLESVDLYCLLKESNPNEIKDWLWYEDFVRDYSLSLLLE